MLDAKNVGLSRDRLLGRGLNRWRWIQLSWSNQIGSGHETSHGTCSFDPSLLIWLYTLINTILNYIWWGALPLWAHDFVLALGGGGRWDGVYNSRARLAKSITLNQNLSNFSLKPIPIEYYPFHNRWIIILAMLTEWAVDDGWKRTHRLKTQVFLEFWQSLPVLSCFIYLFIFSESRVWRTIGWINRCPIIDSENTESSCLSVHRALAFHHGNHRITLYSIVLLTGGFEVLNQPFLEWTSHSLHFSI